MTDFLAGITAMGFASAGLFFLRFWTRTNDALFAIFAVAFWLMALNQTLATIIDFGREELGWVYLLRLAAFVLIIIGILHKNLRSRQIDGGSR